MTRPPSARLRPASAAVAFAAMHFAALGAADAHRFTVLGGAEAWNDPNVPAHGYLQLTYDYRDLPRGARLLAIYNTDTLQLTYDRLRLSDDAEAAFLLKGQAINAGLSTDYHRDATNDQTRAFRSSYIEAGASTKLRLNGHTYLEVALHGRRWFMAEGKETDAVFDLPDDAWVLEPRLRYFWWGLHHDAVWDDPHRSFPRLRGFAIGFELGVDFRSEHRTWGARDDTVFEPRDHRNEPETVILRGRQWAMWGQPIVEGFRVQVRQWAGVGTGEDDLTRVRLGGLNPYVVPIAGAPWASWISDAFVSAELTTPVRLGFLEGLEASPLVTATYLRDPGRTDSLDRGGLIGLGAMADWRRGAWQVDLRAGWSPQVQDRSGRASFNALLAVGWATQ